MQVVEGDLFATTRGAIGHGINCKGVMGAGVARIVRQKYPEMYAAYKAGCEDGTITPGSMFPWFDEASGLWIYNMASQDKPGPDAKLSWLASSAAAALDHADAHNISVVSIPQIGCGIGGLLWEDVEPALRQVERNRKSSFRVIVLPES